MKNAKIAAAYDVKDSVLARAHNLLLEMKQTHERGVMWVPLHAANCWAVGALKKMDMITVIKFNDGEQYGQINGVV